ncbi:YdcF family protein [Chitinophaga nivalis]|uniref:YdcF family protein n=1 Tax=Chitinophaga nivalis TaxID=2991709 RepID=A0ABT3IID4_9BACT|nr:YdcF family protein [Chitinophaga nivalis]MCW3466578.1 YdcF family protein [Chitinophaga nivalis]MCW3483731.1 YdcF family protein [Chitinophaga nivalis]
MYSLKKYIVLGALLFLYLPYVAGQSATPDRHYKFLNSRHVLQDKNFYLFTLLEQLPAVKKAVAADTTLKRIGEQYRQRISGAVTGAEVSSLTSPFVFSPQVQHQVTESFARLWLTHPAEMKALLQQMRSSGLFQLYAGFTDEALLARACEDAGKGVSYIINAYTTNEGFRYPKIDSAAWYVKAPAYKQAVAQLLQQLKKDNRSQQLFFRPSLDLALGLLLLNKHDEAARYEPLMATNQEAYTHLKSIDWNKYTYSALLILGAGPSDNAPISEACKNRCRMGADMFRKGMAPGIIVSGGHVHPFGTPYAEAVEMKKYLVNELKVPAAAVILEPYARHTTTNVRNAARIAWRSGIPVDKRMMCVSDALHLSYVTSRMFEQRSQEELGYLPAADIQQGELFFISFVPDIRCLQADARDPLDP